MKLPLLASLTISMSLAAAPPPTEKKPVTDEYHGVKVSSMITDGWKRQAPRQ